MWRWRQVDCRGCDRLLNTSNGVLPTVLCRRRDKALRRAVHHESTCPYTRVPIPSLCHSNASSHHHGHTRRARLDRAVARYRNSLKLPQKPGTETGIAFFATDGCLLGLYPRDQLAADITVAAAGTGFSGFALAHNVASPKAVDTVLDEAVSAGTTLVKAGQKVFWGGYFADLDGFYWEVAWSPHWQDAHQTS